jgi:hypothetical protein
VVSLGRGDPSPPQRIITAEFFCDNGEFMMTWLEEWICCSIL